jgi:hypothetical protein
MVRVHAVFCFRNIPEGATGAAFAPSGYAAHALLRQPEQTR